MARGSNRNTNNRKMKQERGDERVINKKPSFEKDWNLDWFHPEGRQHLIVESMEENPLTIVKAPSGCGKSTTILWKALNEYKNGNFRKIILIKNPTEAGDDQLGFLTGNKNDKLTSHMESMKSIFYQFMSKNKLENDISSGNIAFDIPNYLSGKTIDNTIIILEEAQMMSPNTIKLCIERAGVGSIVVVAGDSKQCYSVKKREDGLKDLIERTTYDSNGVRFSQYTNIVGYIEMESDNNMRSELSKFITEIY